MNAETEVSESVRWRFAGGRSLSVAVGYELYDRTHAPLTPGLVALPPLHTLKPEPPPVYGLEAS
jgi:hypothetical protein